MIKALLEELLRVKTKSGLTLEIDEGLLGMINAQIAGFVEVDDVLRVFRTLPKILEVEKVVERDLGRHLGYLTEGRAVNTESAKIVDRVVEKPVTLKQEVPVIHEVGVTQIAIH